MENKYASDLMVGVRARLVSPGCAKGSKAKAVKVGRLGRIQQGQNLKEFDHLLYLGKTPTQVVVLSQEDQENQGRAEMEAFLL